LELRFEKCITQGETRELTSPEVIRRPCTLAQAAENPPPQGEEENWDLTQGDQITPSSDIHKLRRAPIRADKLKRIGRAGERVGALQRFPSGELNVKICIQYEYRFVSASTCASVACALQKAKACQGRSPAQRSPTS
jgi:hypothetical protein